MGEEPGVDEPPALRDCGPTVTRLSRGVHSRRPTLLASTRPMAAADRRASSVRNASTYTGGQLSRSGVGVPLILELMKCALAASFAASTATS
jgi:hypothetical protein